MTHNKIEIDASIGPVGAIVKGIDLSQPLPDAAYQILNKAWLQHHVLFFHNQSLTPAQQANFAENFGALDVYPFMTAVDAHPNVIPIIKEADATLNFGGAWHTDTSYSATPPKATLLYAVEVPEDGGDTLFADATAAFSALSEGMQKMLSPLTGIYTPKLVHAAGGFYNNVAAQENLGDAYGGNEEFSQQEIEHPIIRTHVDTNNKSIYCSKPHTHRIKGWTREESSPIFEFLSSHYTQAQFVTRFQWQNGSLALWDNRCVFHNALNDYQGHRRHMHRVIVKGERPE